MRAKKDSYNASSIKVLKYPESVRLRPSMYIGSVETPDHLAFEIIDNSCDEALAGHATAIIVTICKNGYLTVSDDGRGIPFDKHKETGKSAVDLVMTFLHAGAKFDNDSYKTSGGLHGVGASVVNALSEHLIVESKRGGKRMTREYKCGEPVGKMKIVEGPKKSGTTVSFKPDDKIFKTTHFSFQVIKERLEEISFLNDGLKVRLTDERTGEVFEAKYSNGLAAYVKSIEPNCDPLNGIIYVSKESKDLGVEVHCALQWKGDLDGERILAFTNTIGQEDGGTHVVGFKNALTRTVNKYMTGKKDFEIVTSDDIRTGLVAIIDVRMSSPQFSSQVKSKLVSESARTVVESISSELEEYFERNQSYISKICSLATSAARAREAAKTARELVRQTVTATMASPLMGKLADCQSKKPKECELFICEGDSAGGCFSGDTKVKLADGRDLSFMDIVDEHARGIDNYVYTIDGSHIGIAKLTNPRMTKIATRTVTVKLDNDEEIVCTPSHKFMLRNGNYKSAKALVPGESLMPLYMKKTSFESGDSLNGYDMVLDLNGKWQYSHVISDMYNLARNVYHVSRGPIRHHKDFRKTNNNPDNIERMNKIEHLMFHAALADKTLRTPEVLEKLRVLHKTEEFREKIRKWAARDDVKKMLSDRAKKLWENDEYKAKMGKSFLDFYYSNQAYREESAKRLYAAQTEYWSDESHRLEASLATTKRFADSPELRQSYSEMAKEQWNDDELRKWRAQKTKEQWTPEFRAKYKMARNKTYYRKTIEFARQVLDIHGDISHYEEARLSMPKKDTTIMSIETFCHRFFDDNLDEMLSAITKYNHKVVRVSYSDLEIPVYDLEVPRTHNFALSSGVFVHNSAKMGRDRKYQAILPLRGKIINAEKASLKKLLDNNEIQSIVAAVGTGIGRNFDIGNLRYHKIFLMCDADSVTGDTPIFIDSDGYLRLVTVGDLVKTSDLQNGCQVSSCDVTKGLFGVCNVSRFIHHGTDKQLYRVETENGYSVKVTADHNVFVHDGNNIVCRRTTEIKPKDHMVLPARLPRKDSVVSFGFGRGKMVMSAKVAHFVGICLGAKVAMISKNSASISLNTAWRVDRATHAIKALGGSWVVTRTDSGYTVKIIGGKPVSIIKSLSLVGIRDLPNEIFNVTRHVQMAFLNGYFSSAGCSVNANDHSCFVCYGPNEIATGIVTVLRQMSQWPKIYRSGSGALVEISNRSMQNIVSCAKAVDKKGGISYRLLKVKSVVEIDNEENSVYDLSVPSHQNFVAGDGGFLLHNTDGEHIRVLLLTFFYRFMNDLITNGHIYVAQPPLYRCIWGGKARYALSDKELLALKIGKKFGFLQIKTSGVWNPVEPIDIIDLSKSTRIRSEGSKKSFTVSEILSEASAVNDIKIQRFKGLGEMSEEQLWDTTLNPENRKLIQVQIPDAEMADKMVELLMGNDIESRRQYILDNCDMADLDT